MYFIEASELAEKFAINQYCRWLNSELPHWIILQIAFGSAYLWGRRSSSCERGNQRRCASSGKWGKEKKETRKHRWVGEGGRGNEQADQELGKWWQPVQLLSSKTGGYWGRLKTKKNRWPPGNSRPHWECLPPGTRSLAPRREVFWIDLKTPSSANPLHQRYSLMFLNI